MKISNVYIGGWFQRTMLQLTEIYDFLRNCDSKINLDKEKLKEFHKKNKKTYHIIRILFI